MGIVYVLTNPAMQGLVKIGKTTRSTLENRMGELYSTGVPVPFNCEIAVEVDDEASVESVLHKAFAKFRINPRREFFEVDPEHIKPLIALLGREISLDVDAVDIDPESQEAGEDYQRKRATPSHFEFLEPLAEELDDRYGIRIRRRRKKQPNWDFHSGVEDIRYNIGFHYEGFKVRVRLSFHRSDVEFNRRLFDQLNVRRSEIENAIGEDLEWERVVTRRKGSMITAYAPGSLDSSEDELEDARAWLVSTTVKFNEVFGPFLEELVPQVEDELR